MHFIINFIFICGFVLLFPSASRAEFVKLRQDSIKTCKLKLPAISNIDYQCQEIIDESVPLDVWHNRLSFHFGKISPTDFLQLKHIYGSWSLSSSTIAYDPHKSYNLVDFLPPLMQAVNGHRFIPEATKIETKDWDFLKLISNRESHVVKSLYLNCWGLVYEILRLAKNPQAKPMAFMSQSSITLDKLRSSSDEILTLKEPAEFPIAGDIRAGDFILILHRSATGYEYLDHVAIALDRGIYFEKAGTGKDVPMRIIDEETIVKTWMPGVFYYEVRRPQNNASLPHPNEIFGVSSSAIQKHFPLKDIPPKLANNTNFMWDLETKSLSSISLFHAIELELLLINKLGQSRLSDKMYEPLLD